MGGEDPRTIIDRSAMTRSQWVTVAIMIGLNALDGFDVLSISFAAPGIAAAWGIDRAALGIILSMELFGMALGSLMLGGVADRVGRRATILGCLLVMALGMAGASLAGGIVVLCGWRVLTGLGIGGMLAATNAAVAETANARRRDLCVVLMAGGYPMGTVIGGSIAALLLRGGDWPAVFQFGAIVTLAFVPLVLWAAPESIAFLIHRGGPDALPAVNRALARLGHPPVAALPPSAPPARARLSVAALFGPGIGRVTALLTAGYFAHIMTFYFVVKWIPKIVADLGYSPASAAGVLVWASVGGASGSVLLGLFTSRVPLVRLTIGAMLLSVAMVVLFGRGQGSLATLSLVAAATGFVTNAGVVGLYALIARSFPTGLRATATGFVIGIGRGGSALAPVVAGLLFAAGEGLATVAVVMAGGSLIGAIALLVLARQPTAT